MNSLSQNLGIDYIRVRSWWLGGMLVVLCIGTIGIVVKSGILGSGESCEAGFIRSNGSGTAPWFYFTVYTIGIVFLSYYLGGVFNSYVISEEDFTSNAFLRLKSQLTLLPISQFIRKQARSKKNNINFQSTTDQISVQRDFLIDAILESYVFPWYHRISDERMFPTHSRQLIQSAFDNLRQRLQKINRTTMMIDVIQILHCHWNEYCIAVSKINSPNELLIQKFKLIHPYVNNREEMSKQYETLISILLPDLLPRDLHSQFLCKFLSGILVKGIFLYYAEVMSDPKWVNTMLVSMISAGSYVNTCDTSSNQSGSNISSAPPSPSPTPILEPMRATFDVDPTYPEEEIVSKMIENKSHLNEEGTANPETLEDSLMEVVENKGSIHNFLRIDSMKHRQVKKGSSSPVMTSIQAALSSLLSATALPLLPDGASYAISETSSPIDLEISPKTPSPKDEVDKGGDLSLPVFTTTTKDMTIRFTKERDVIPNSPSNRHNSWEESGSISGKHKSMTPSGTATTKSLDESLATQFKLRQEEFNFGDEDREGKRVMESSPMYEEPEDFAATIAKLRSLLEQRESQTNVMENLQMDSRIILDSQPVTEPIEKIQAEAILQSQPMKPLISKIRPSLDSQSSASSLTSDGSNGSTFAPQGSLDVENKLYKIEDAEEDVEPVMISRFFLNVSITKTESCGDASDHFTLYCIQYEGVYIEDDGDEGMPKLVLRTTTVKRSFKEFLLLQSQLEDSPIWRPHLRGIKTPNKWLNLSFSNHGSGNHRRTLLERYLQQISSHQVLGFCPELRHFMAYGEDGFQMFGLHPFTKSHLPRFDKLTKTFTGVLNSLRDALPSFESELQATGNGNGEGGNSAESKGKKLLPSFLQFGDKNHMDDERKSIETSGIMSIDQPLESKGADCDEGSGSTDGTDSDLKKEGDSESDDQIAPNTAIKNEFMSRSENSLDSIYPLASSVTKLLCDVLWLPHQRPHSASVSAVMSVSGKSLENYLQESLDILLSEEAFLGYLEWLTCSVREWGLSDKSEAEKEETLYTVEDLKLCLKQRVPIWVRWMWGRSRLDLTIDRLAEFFQISLLNHDFILSVVELVFSNLTTKSTDCNSVD